MSPEELKQMVEMSGTINMEIFYWWCTAVMILIHVGFLAYEIGASRVKNALASAVKNILALAFIIPTFFMFGWWIYLAMPNGLTPDFAAGAAGEPWAASMGPNLADNATGVFWAAFAMFSATTASILSGAVIERIRISAFIILAVLVGSGVWILAASWGWHPTGWLMMKWGFHDTAAAGCVHMIAGWFTLGVLFNLGPRLGKYTADGKAVAIPGHSMPMTTIGLMLIIVGFFGFLGGCIIYKTGAQWVTIYNTPATLSAFAFNTLMGFSGGVIGAFLISRGSPFWMMSGGLAGIISVAPGLELYYPPLAFVLALVGGGLIKPIGDLLENRLKIDDAVGAFAVHAGAGTWGIIALGIFASGYPHIDAPATSLAGQLGGAAVMTVLGFGSGFLASLGLKKLGLLRSAPEAELLGLDAAELPARPYPESVPATALAAAASVAAATAPTGASVQGA
jgi:Amt family ammonium transporter